MTRMKPKTKPAKRRKVAKVLKEFKRGDLHSGSKDGPPVTDPAQALAIAMREAGLPRRRRKEARG